MVLNSQTFIKQANELGAKECPFLFIIDYELKNCHIYKLDSISNDILYSIRGNTNQTESKKKEISIKILNTISYDDYLTAFNKVATHQQQGDSYLTNLTFPTELSINSSLEEIFHSSHAPYKLCYKNQFVVFSPECFIRSSKGSLFSYPMKGTIDAEIPNAENIIMNDQKELAEHATIVDLIRNDLSIFTHNVKINRFRFINRINTNRKNLLQISSEIEGKLPENWTSKIGSILFSMLPAGSVTGAPKIKTLEIIKEAEQYARRYYTGIAGIFDGKEIDSFVLIRYIENMNGKMLYKSGGGITVYSDPKKEYDELINKIYVPLS